MFPVHQLPLQPQVIHPMAHHLTHQYLHLLQQTPQIVSVQLDPAQHQELKNQR